MKEILITNESSGQRLDKFLKRLLPSCPSNLLYKQLRKKNITLNGSKADGHELLKGDDVVNVFFSDETYEKFSACEAYDVSRYQKAYDEFGKIDVVYTDDDILIFDKPAGILSQSGSGNDLSMNDYLIGFLLNEGTVSAASLASFKPSICNRLDRNTSGLILCSRSLKGARYLSRIISGHGIEKYYAALVNGRFDNEGIHTSYVKKDEKNNKLIFTGAEETGAVMIKTGFEVIRAGDEATLLKVRLYTGKSHQIRAHLSHLGFPIIGDPKYGSKKGIGANRQMLHACCIKVADDDPEYNGIVWKAPLPDDMRNICRKTLGGSGDLVI